MNDARDIIRTAIDDSFNRRRTVHLTWTQDLEDELRGRDDLDDEAENGGTHEFWGHSPTGEWRVHLEHEVGPAWAEAVEACEVSP